jgi:hypothetical protein
LKKRFQVYLLTFGMLVEYGTRRIEMLLSQLKQFWRAHRLNKMLVSLFVHVICTKWRCLKMSKRAKSVIIPQLFAVELLGWHFDFVFQQKCSQALKSCLNLSEK